MFDMSVIVFSTRLERLITNYVASIPSFEESNNRSLDNSDPVAVVDKIATIDQLEIAVDKILQVVAER